MAKAWSDLFYHPWSWSTTRYYYLDGYFDKSQAVFFSPDGFVSLWTPAESAWRSSITTYCIYEHRVMHCVLNSTCFDLFMIVLRSWESFDAYGDTGAAEIIETWRCTSLLLVWYVGLCKYALLDVDLSYLWLFQLTSPLGAEDQLTLTTSLRFHCKSEFIR